MNTIALLTLVAFATTDQFVVSPASLEPQPGDVPAAVAFAKAHTTLQSLGDAIHPYELPGIMVLRTPSASPKRWEVQFKAPGRNDSIQVHVTAKSNSMTSILTPDARFANTPSEYRPEPSLLPTAAAAETHLRALASALGVPSHWDVARVSYRPETEDVRASSSIEIRGVYRARPVLGAYALISMDPHNGRLMSAQLKLEFVIETEEPILTAAQAKAIADQVYAEALAGRPAQPYNPDKPPFLCYRSPGEFIGAKVPVEAYPPEQHPRRLRIAWKVNYGAEHGLFIDGHTGKLIGGYFKAPRRTE